MNAVSFWEGILVTTGLVVGAWCISSLSKQRVGYYMGWAVFIANTAALTAMSVLRVVTA